VARARGVARAFLARAAGKVGVAGDCGRGGKVGDGGDGGNGGVSINMNGAEHTISSRNSLLMSKSKLNRPHLCRRFEMPIHPLQFPEQMRHSSVFIPGRGSS
jgi:hypothetical protein